MPTVLPPQRSRNYAVSHGFSVFELGPLMARRGLKLIKCGLPICLKADAACPATSFTTRVRPMQRRSKSSSRVPAPNKQLEGTVRGRRLRAACASIHCAQATRWTRGRAAAQLRCEAKHGRCASNQRLSRGRVW